jgi:hypothetical protein
MSFGRYCGYGKLELADGNRYEGEFLNGLFHGRGTLFFPEGKLEGTWELGKQVEGQFTFSDGLEYDENDWGYCIEGDRRFHSEKTTSDDNGIAAAGELNYFDTGLKRVVPLGTYDAGNGIFTPSTGQVSAYDNPLEVREATPEEKEWIIAKAPKASTKDMGVK